MMPNQRPEVALFVTCIVDLVRPDIGFSSVKVLEAAGCKVVVPALQTCCGQPNYNGGDQRSARATAMRNIDLLFDYDYVVVPSGSCAAMIKCDYPRLLAEDATYADRARELATRVWELACFLVDVVNYHPDPVRRHGKVTYHDGCAGLRELGIKAQPRRLLARAGAEIVESSQAETCCGFGGMFCVKYPEISNNMVQRKVDDAGAAGVPCLVSGDLGCILNLEGKIHREGVEMQVVHFVELLADQP